MKRHSPFFRLGSSFLFCGTMLASAAWAQPSPVPFVNQPLVPTSVAPGHGAFTLTVNGTGFAPGATVEWNGQARVTTRVSSSQLEAAITAADVAQATTASITVVNPSVGGASNVVYFPVGRPPSAIAFARRDLPVILPSGAYMTGLAVADFNNDGKLDVAIATTQNATTNTMEVFLGNGDGTFRAPVSTTFEIGIYSMVAGDFNGDGNIDLAIASPEPNQSGGAEAFLLYTLLGTGDGQFTLAGNGGISGSPLAAADFNQDGALDVVSTSTDYTGIDYYPAVNLGTGTGPVGGSLRMGDTYAFGIPSIGDFNHDGNVDVAVPGRDAYSFYRQLYVFLGDGSGQFGIPQVYSASGNAKAWNAGSSAVADLNGDGNLDILTENIGVFLGNGDGTFNLEQGASLSGAGLQLADFNNDNKLDAVALGNLYYPSEQQIVSLSLGNGDGTFQTPLNWAALDYSVYLAVGDFNGDGKQDLIAAGTDLNGANPGTTTLSFFLQTTFDISPAILNFGSVKPGSSGTLTATLTNIGQIDESIGSIELTNPWQNFTAVNNCGKSLAPNASCAVTVTFAPKAAVVFSGAVRITYGGALGSPQSILLTGSGS